MQNAKPTRKTTTEEKLQCVALQNQRSVARVREGFSGQVLTHWKEGCPVEEEISLKKPILKYVSKTK